MDNVFSKSADSLRSASLWLMAAALVCVLGCGEAADVTRVKTFPTTGVVKINGVRAAGVEVRLVTPGEVPPERVLPRAVTGADGMFAMQTYTAGDGAPAGSYNVLIRWPFAGIAEPTDRLNQTQSNPKHPPYKVTVGEQPTVLPTFEITAHVADKPPVGTRSSLEP